jgi:hypothetical protein
MRALFCLFGLTATAFAAPKTIVVKAAHLFDGKSDAIV